MRNDRRDRGAGVEYDATERVLRVGQRRRRLSRRAGNRVVLQAYLGLVAEQRPSPPRERIHLRDRDVDLLAGLLDLDDDALEDQLAELLDLTEVEAQELGKRLRSGRVRAAAAAVGMGVLTLAPLGSLARSEARVPVTTPAHTIEVAFPEATPPPSHDVVPTAAAPAEPPTDAPAVPLTAAPATDPDAGPSEPDATSSAPEPVLGPASVIERGDDGDTLTYIESPPAPIAEDGTDIGTALVIERG